MFVGAYETKWPKLQRKFSEKKSGKFKQNINPQTKVAKHDVYCFDCIVCLESVLMFRLMC